MHKFCAWCQLYFTQHWAVLLAASLTKFLPSYKHLWFVQGWTSMKTSAQWYLSPAYNSSLARGHHCCDLLWPFLHAHTPCRNFPWPVCDHLIHFCGLWSLITAPDRCLLRFYRQYGRSSVAVHTHQLMSPCIQPDSLLWVQNQKAQWHSKIS